MEIAFSPFPGVIIYEIELIKNRSIPEPQYENDEFYPVTAYGSTLDVAAKKVIGYMIDYLVENLSLNRNDAYMICSLAGNLHIAE